MRFVVRFASFVISLSAMLPLVTVCALVSVASMPTVAQAQGRVRPAFSPTLKRGMKMHGTVRLQIVARRDGLSHEFAPIGRGGWVATVRINGHPLRSVSRLPAVVEWNTREWGDGVHEVLVSVQNGGAEVRVEGAQVIVDNAGADTEEEFRLAKNQAQTQSTLDAPALVLTVPTEAKRTLAPARITASPNLRQARATALLRSGNRLYMGLPDGGIAYFSTSIAKPSGTVVRLSGGGGPVANLAVVNGQVWWTTGDGRCVYAYNEKGRTVTRYIVTATLAPPKPTVPPALAWTEEPLDGAQETMPPAPTPKPKPVVSAKPSGWVRRIASLNGRVLLIGDAGVAHVLNAKTGNLTDIAQTDLLPNYALVRSDGIPAHLYVTEGGPKREPFIVSVARWTKARQDSYERNPLYVNESGVPPRFKRYEVFAWHKEKRGWVLDLIRPTDATPQQPAQVYIGAVNGGMVLATAEREGPEFHGLFGGAMLHYDALHDFSYKQSPSMPSSTDRIAFSESGVWWEQRGIVFHANPQTGGRSAFLPWNVPGGTGAVLALAPDENGVWVATTSSGIRYIRPGKPSTTDGYNGYVRARLGSETLQPPTTRDTRIADAMEIWQGTRYVWGGQSLSGTDCSGYVMRMHQVAGVSIPRTSSQMRSSGQGRRVRDELRWGDTLVYPGHCALYIGDGKTSETVGGSRGGSVSSSSVWIRSNVVVRRFLK